MELEALIEKLKTLHGNRGDNPRALIQCQDALFEIVDVHAFSDLVAIEISGEEADV